MKLQELHTEVLWEGELDGEDIQLIIHEGVTRFAKKGGIVRGAMKFITNPVVAGLAAGYALTAYDKYKKNKRMTTTFFAKGHQERQLYTKIVSDLMKTGNYKKTHEKFVDGGYLWVLKRSA